MSNFIVIIAFKKYLYFLTENTYVIKANKIWLLFFHFNVILPGNT